MDTTKPQPFVFASSTMQRRRETVQYDAANALARFAAGRIVVPQSKVARYIQNWREAERSKRQ